ncbi:MAG: preprotein translocase subunit SecE [Candidatus Eisenbacteria bacterium]|uniref:Protein translocase subunit SecE n=1 Tax=Eiseniibacteriota bacterium TaxID=2212470 RepID=A0A948W4M9_UNCEI|nr:preprotein translocase subunit SecE [Candidatus Eisenbacteria bacterium]MBU2689514.1 preprotein translocase subunit SecE [Candidatus Eisenbacteria bacterium]
MSKITELRTFISEVAVESKKVTWPSWADMKASTWVVIIAVFFITFFIFVVDQIVGRIVGLVL